MILLNKEKLVTEEVILLSVLCVTSAWHSGSML